MHGGWIQRYRQTAYSFPDSRKALDDAVEAAGPTLGPVLLSMSEYLMSSYNETYESRYSKSYCLCVKTTAYVMAPLIA